MAQPTAWHLLPAVQVSSLRTPNPDADENWRAERQSRRMFALRRRRPEVAEIEPAPTGNGYRFPAKGVQTRALIPIHEPGEAGAKGVNDWLPARRQASAPPSPSAKREPTETQRAVHPIGWTARTHATLYVCARSALRRRRCRRIARALLGHELVELSLVLGRAQALQELLELALLVLEPAQGLLAVIVEGAIAARPRRLPPGACAAAHLLNSTLPAGHVAVPRATHPSAPDNEGQKGKTHRPPEREAQDHQRDPGWFSQVIELCNDRHLEASP